MIKEKFLKFLLWFKDHFSFLLEVVFRLAVGETKKLENHRDFEEDHKTDTTKEESKDD